MRHFLVPFILKTEQLYAWYWKKRDHVCLVDSHHKKNTEMNITLYCDEFLNHYVFKLLVWIKIFYSFLSLIIGHSQQHLTTFLLNVFNVHWHQCLSFVIPSNQKDKTQQQQQQPRIKNSICIVREYADKCWTFQNKCKNESRTRE